MATREATREVTREEINYWRNLIGLPDISNEEWANINPERYKKYLTDQWYKKQPWGQRPFTLFGALQPQMPQTRWTPQPATPTGTGMVFNPETPEGLDTGVDWDAPWVKLGITEEEYSQTHANKYEEYKQRKMASEMGLSYGDYLRGMMGFPLSGAEGLSPWEKTQYEMWQTERADELRNRQLEAQTAASQWNVQNMQRTLSGAPAADDKDRQLKALQFENQMQSIISDLNRDPQRNRWKIIEYQTAPNPYQYGAQSTPASQQAEQAWEYMREIAPQAAVERVNLESGKYQKGTPEWGMAQALVGAEKNAANLAKQLEVSAYGQKVVDTARSLKMPVSEFALMAQQYAQNPEAAKWANDVETLNALQSVSSEPSVTGGTGETEEQRVNRILSQRRTQMQQKAFGQISAGVQGGQWKAPALTPSGQSWNRMTPSQQSLLAGYQEDIVGGNWGDLYANMQKMKPRDMSLGTRWTPARQRSFV